MAGPNQQDLMSRLRRPGGQRGSTLVGATLAHAVGGATTEVAPPTDATETDATGTAASAAVVVEQEAPAPADAGAPQEPAAIPPVPPVVVSQPVTPPTTPVLTPSSATLLSKLGVANPTISQRGEPVSLRLDAQLDKYLRDKYLIQRRTASRSKRSPAGARGPKPTLVSILREAMNIKVPDDILLQAKPLLNSRRSSYGLVRINVEVSREVLDEVINEVNLHSTNNAMLSQAAVIEIRLLCWAASQEDWPVEN